VKLLRNIKWLDQFLSKNKHVLAIIFVPLPQSIYRKLTLETPYMVGKNLYVMGKYEAEIIFGLRL
jgi:hypothetical protein